MTKVIISQRYEISHFYLQTYLIVVDINTALWHSSLWVEALVAVPVLNVGAVVCDLKVTEDAVIPRYQPFSDGLRGPHYSSVGSPS